MTSTQCTECLEKQKEINRLRAECERLTTALKEMEALNSANQALVAEYEQMLGEMDLNEEQDDTEELTEDTEGTPEVPQQHQQHHQLLKEEEEEEEAEERMVEAIKKLKSQKINLEIENEDLLNKVRELEASQESLTEERNALLERLALVEVI